MVRLLAVLSVVMAVATFGFYLHHLGKGPFASLAARHQREMKDRTEAPVTVEPMTREEFLALPRDLSVAEYSGLERRAVAVEGRVSVLMRAIDGDYHAELDPLPDSTGAPPLPGITTEITPAWHGDDVRGWGFERLAEAFRSDRAGATPWDGGPARVRISGWLLYDHESDVLPRMFGWPIPKRAIDWEIHPVTKIERWDDARLAWVEVKR